MKDIQKGNAIAMEQAEKNKAKKWMRIIIEKLYLIVMFLILIATLLVDKYNENNSFMNQANWANGGYYLLAALILFAIAFFYYKKKDKDIGKKTYYILLAVLFVLTLIPQILVSAWITPVTGGDFGTAANTAVSLAEGGTFQGIEYYEIHPNNVNITVLLSWIYGIVGKWSLVVLVSAFCTNISVILAAYVVRKVTGNRLSALIIAALGELVIALAGRAFLPYSDTLAMPFIIGMFAVYFSGMKNRFKLPLILMLGMIGSWVKVTALIPMLALGIYIFLTASPFKGLAAYLKGMKKDGIRAGKGLIIAVILSVLVLAGGFIAGKCVRKQYDYQAGEKARGWQFMFMVGQNNKNTGQVGGDHGVYWKKIQKKYSSRSDQLKACFDTALTLISDRGPVGNVMFYIKKLNVAFNDGSFHDIQPYNKKNIEKNLIYNVMNNEGKYYRKVADVRQTAWDFILILLAIPLFLFLFGRKRNTIFLLFEIMLLGIILYLMIFEGRSKYLYMYLPAIFAFAGAVLHRFLQAADAVLKRHYG